MSTFTYLIFTCFDTHCLYRLLNKRTLIVIQERRRHHCNPRGWFRHCKNLKPYRIVPFIPFYRKLFFSGYLMALQGGVGVGEAPGCVGYVGDGQRVHGPQEEGLGYDHHWGA